MEGLGGVFSIDTDLRGRMGRGGEKDWDPSSKVLPESESGTKRVVADSRRGA